MSSLAYFILFAQACLILNASGAVLSPLGYEAGLGACGRGLTSAAPCLSPACSAYPATAPVAYNYGGLNAAYGCGTGFAGPYKGAPFAYNYGGLNAKYGCRTGFARPYNGYAAPYGAAFIA